MTAGVAASLARGESMLTAQSSGASAGIIATTREGRTLIERRELADLPDTEAYAVDAQPGYIVLAAIHG